jgi:outer membrane receptor protein involved in Fe transport
MRSNNPSKSARACRAAKASHRFAVALAIFAAFAIFCALSPRALAVQQSPGNRPLRLEGFVRDQTGAAVEGVEVVLGSASLTLRATTDEEGRFVFTSSTLAGAATLAVRAGGFAIYERRLEDVGAVETPLEVLLLPAPLSEELTVTATRTETRLGETAASVVVLSGEELEVTAAATLDDALRQQVPGFQLFRRSGSRTANPTSQGVSLRGVGASGASRAVVLSDSIPLNDPFGGWVYWGRVPRAGVGRIEVLRGEASALYGSAALGGVVQFISRRTEQAPQASIEISYGSQHTPDASLYASASRGRWGASLSAEAFATDGYIPVEPDSRGLVDVPADSRRSALVLTLERELEEGARVFVRGSLYGEARVNGTRLQTNRTHLRQLSAGLDWQTKSAGAFQARAYGGTQLFDQTFTAVDADRDTETLTRVQRVPAQSTGASVQWSRGVGARLALVAGAEAREVRGASDELAYVRGLPSAFVDAGGRERSLGFFLQGTARMARKVFMTATARGDRWRNYAAFESSRPVAPGSPTTLRAFPDRAESSFSPSLSLLYKPHVAVSVFASGGRAFRAPTLNELYRSFRVGDVLTLANPDLRAERLAGIEAGAGVSALGGRLDARGALFWAEVSRTVANVTVAQTPALITRQRQNLGRTRSRGFEVELEARPSRRLVLSGGYTYTDARVKTFPANATLEGLLIPQVPRSVFAFQARYLPASRLTLGLQGRASSAQFDDDQNLLRLGGYFTLDALASARLTSRFDLFVAAENLFDERYDIGRTPVRTLGPPRFVRIGLRLRLGAR